MNRLKELFTSLEYKLFSLCFIIANRIGEHLDLSDRTYVSTIDRFIKMPLFFGRYQAMVEKYDGPTDFGAALASTNYAERHFVANKIIMSYLVGEYEASDVLLVKAAEVALEPYEYKHTDVTNLVNVWKSKRGQLTDEGAFLDEELAILDKLQEKR